MSRGKYNKEPIKLREKKLANGNISLYLDVYYNGDRSYEFLKIYLIEKPKNQFDRQSNKENLELANRIKAKRIEELLSGSYGFKKKAFPNADFIKYCDDYVSRYTKKDIRTLKSSVNKFKQFIEQIGLGTVKMKDVDQNLVIGYKDYLEQHQTGEGPKTYFSRFRKIINHAHRDGLFPEYPIPRLKFSTPDITKGVLTSGELQLLSKTYCGSDVVKRAFLFSCNTGLRFGDIKGLLWSNINGEYLNKTINKTGNPHTIKLNSTAMRMVGETGESDQLVFMLPSFSSSARTIKNWVKRAEINKRITWHSARHTFGTLLLEAGFDVKTVGRLMDQKNINHTLRYLTISEKRKEDAVNSLPEL